jgi:transposase
MIDTELYGKIRRFKNSGASIRYAARELGMSRKTVRRYWDGAHTPGERRSEPEKPASPEKQVIMKALVKYFEDNMPFSSGKQTINAQTAWKALRDTYHVGESTVRAYVHELKQQNPETFMPLDFEPGEVIQVDWCEVKICINGHLWKAPVFCSVLPYSYDIFAMILPNAQWPCFMSGHIGAFEHYGGVPERVFYDNLRSAVLRGFGAGAVKQGRFKLFEAHYSFEAVFMNKESGNEKGAVENLCGLIRQVAFTPIPQGKNLKEVQEEVTRRCLDYRYYHKIKGRTRPILEMSNEERPYLRPLPIKRFEAHESVEALVGSDQTFRYDAVKYSLPVEYASKTVTLRVLPYEIEAWYKGSLIYTHIRSFDKARNVYIAGHYLPLLEAKPRSARNAAPLKYGTMPPELEKFREKCTAKDKYEQLASIMLLGRSTDARLLLAAVDYANKTGLPSFNKVALYLDLEKSRGKALADDPVAVDQLKLDEYDALLGMEGETDE